MKSDYRKTKAGRNVILFANKLTGQREKFTGDRLVICFPCLLMLSITLFLYTRLLFSVVGLIVTTNTILPVTLPLFPVFSLIGSVKIEKVVKYENQNLNN